MKKEKKLKGDEGYYLMLFLSYAMLTICAIVICLSNWIPIWQVQGVIAIVALMLGVAAIGVWLGKRNVLVGAAILALAVSGAVQRIAWTTRLAPRMHGAARNIAIREICDHLREDHAKTNAPSLTTNHSH